MAKKFLHNDAEFQNLVLLVAEELAINPYLVEKDYWIMHALYGLAHQGFDFELKGGTSLSKAFKVIDRFSEDIDLKIIPPKELKVMAGKNHEKEIHKKSRADFFDWLTKEIKVNGMIASRNNEFDNIKLRSAGIDLTYKATSEPIAGVKNSVLLEAGFDDTTPNEPVTISSWIYDKAFSLYPNEYIDNRAIDVKCYVPEFTFVEKLQAIATKFRQYQETGKLSKNFLRHYYDVYCLLKLPRIRKFLGSDQYYKRRLERFPKSDNPEELSNNPAFNLSKSDLEVLEANYKGTANLYYKGQIELKEIIEKINDHKNKF